MIKRSLPRLLVIDDLFGREVAHGSNRERESLCGKLLLADETPADHGSAARLEIPEPIARVVFWRGQTPTRAAVGDHVENDVPGSIARVRESWSDSPSDGAQRWAMVLLDLCFYTGEVTAASDRRTRGMPSGRAADDNPKSYFGLTLLDAIHR